MADSGKWSCDRCRWDRLRELEEKLENALQQIEDLNRKNSELAEQLRSTVIVCKVVRLAECLLSVG
jgi:Zn-finger protein